MDGACGSGRESLLWENLWTADVAGRSLGFLRVLCVEAFLISEAGGELVSPAGFKPVVVC